jgi:hypothetical protein
LVLAGCPAELSRSSGGNGDASPLDGSSFDHALEVAGDAPVAVTEAGALDGPPVDGPTPDVGGPDVGCPTCWTFPTDRRVTWDPGHRGPIPTVAVKANVKTLGAKADGTTDDAAVFQQAIDSVALAAPGAVLVPAGTYLLESTLELKTGVVLRGEGSDKTHLVVDVPSASYEGGVGAKGGYGAGPFAITAGSTAGSKTLTLSGASGLKAGQVVWIYSENDAAVMYTDPEWNQSWAENAVGQILEIKSVSGQQVTLDAPLRLTHPQARKPELRVLDVVRDVGVEDLHIKRLDQAEDYLVRFERTVNGWLRSCHLEWCTRGHVQLSLARHITIEGNEMHHAYDYGGGGHGYGVQVSSAVSDCLVENNTFYVLRHSLLIQLGANGNVFANNFSRDRKLTDISIHGHYSYMNLFEGNQVEEAVYADYWGPIGPLTTLYRNRVTKAAIKILDHSDKENVVGNTVVSSSGVTVDATVKDALVEYNCVAGQMKATDPAKTPLLPASLWRQGKPSYWGSRPWPCLGADVDTGVSSGWCKLPAEK